MTALEQTIRAGKSVRVSSPNAQELTLGPLSFLRSAWQHRVLLLRLTRREIELRYRGSFLGILWSVIVPLLLLAVYTFVFSIVFKTKWDIPTGGKGTFALLLFSGLILFNVFAECINRAPGLMLSHVTYIKKVVFPLEILPFVSLLGALFNATISAVVLLVGYFAVLGPPPATALLLPLAVLPLLLFSLGISLFLASVGVFIRDLQQFIGVVTMVLMFMTPLFYPVSALPERIRGIIQLSPLASVIEGARQLLFYGVIPDYRLWLLYTVLAWTICWGGFLWFMKTKKGFADVV